MAQITSHTLTVDGAMQGNSVQPRNAVNGSIIFSSKMDQGGRLSQRVPAIISTQILPMNWFDTGPYWAEQGINAKTQRWVTL